jgi:hypothetical protein
VTALALSTTAQAALARVRVNLAAISAVVAVEPFESAPQVERANLLLRTVETLGDTLIEAFDAEKRPHLDACQAVDRAFKHEKAEVKRVTAILRRAIEAYRLEQDRARTAALLAVEAAAARQDAIGANLAVMSIPTPPALEGTGERWSYEIDAIEDLSRVPAHYLTLDLPRVRDEIKRACAEDRPPSIPGIRFKRSLALTVGRL